MRYDEEEDDPTPAKRKREEGASTHPAPNEPDSSELGASSAKRAQRESDPLLGVLTASARPRTTHLLVEGRDGGYMPPIGSVPGFVAEPHTALQPGNVLAVVAPMGCGKTTMVTQWENQLIQEEDASTRFLFLTANRMYATSAAVEQRQNASRLREEGYPLVTAGSYMEDQVDLATCQICLCSLESLHKVESLRYDVIVADEVSSIARLLGGGTMNGYGNVFLLRDLCAARDTRVLALDADLTFKMVDSQPTTIVDDFLQLICPGRPVVQVGMSTPTPGPPASPTRRGASFSPGAPVQKSVIVLVPAFDWNLRSKRSKASPFTPCSTLRRRVANTRALLAFRSTERMF